MQKLPLKILVVDDEPDIVEILSYNLKKENYDVTSASNGRDAVYLAGEIQPDLIILDIRMPGMSGLDACREIRQIEKLKKVPVLFLTADDDEYTTLTAFDAGGTHFVTKPVKPVILSGMIRELLGNQNEH